MHLAGDDFFLAPLYDIASILPYRKLRRSPRGTVMPIGREKHFGRLCGSHIERFANNNDLDPSSCKELMSSLAYAVHDAVIEEVADSIDIPGVRELGTELVRTVAANCEAMLKNLGRNGTSIDMSYNALIDSGTIERS